MPRKPNWTERDLLALVGLTENARLEFKTSALLNNSKKLGADLSRAVSAFANTEGGTLVIGISERKDGKSRVAGGLDEGADPTTMPPERLQQIVEGNISPYLPGIRVHAVRLTGQREGRVAYVVDVPQGSTAYQANDRLYYGRSEYEVRALPDHEIRIRMLRTQVAQANLEIAQARLITAAQEYASRMEKAMGIEAEFGGPVQGSQELRGPKKSTDAYSFRLQVRNTGLLSLAEFAVELTPRGRLASGLPRGLFRFEPNKRIPKIYPEQFIPFPDEEISFHLPEGAALEPGAAVLYWTIYLDNSPPGTGELDLYDYFPVTPAPPP